MQRGIAQEAGDPETKHEMLYEQSLSEAYYGRLTNAREFIQRAAAWARRNDLYGTAAYDLASFAIIEADFGDAAAAHRSASESLTDSKVSGGRMASLALGRAGYISRAQAAADDLAKRYPSSTLLNVYWLPTIRASIALSRNDPSQAVEILRVTSSYELGSDGTLEPIYTRGLAYLRLHRGSEAAAEFQKILDHPGITRNHPRAVLAHLELPGFLCFRAIPLGRAPSTGDFSPSGRTPIPISPSCSKRKLSTQGCSSLAVVAKDSTQCHAFLRRIALLR